LVEDARALIASRATEDVFCTLPVTEKETIADLVVLAEKNFVNFRLVPDMSPLLQRSLAIDTLGLMPVISLRQEPFEKLFNRMVKRSFDIGMSLVVFIGVLSWLTPLLFALIELESKGPLFYTQKRSGIGYMPFTIFKFRTMRVTESDDEFKQAQTNDARVTRLGKILRKLNIDELPQFWNVLKGEMSVVGPRPHPVKLNEAYKDLIGRYMSRHRVLPGLTGLAQVRGFRGNTEDIQRMEKRVQADLHYIENWSFWLDVKIILLTLRNMIVGDKHAY
ncbi:MAG TPA: exopolysaccharide biosynthesis polyprenyl glycosylphosphotransferase, partial [Chitinophagales bacterium]|nr:exopolysaccharide biosynthesis polyprenyl glycosylphosphotransferase [Chitinophagales bacterium]